MAETEKCKWHSVALSDAAFCDVQLLREKLIAETKLRVSMSKAAVVEAALKFACDNYPLAK